MVRTLCDPHWVGPRGGCASSQTQAEGGFPWLGTGQKPQRERKREREISAQAQGQDQRLHKDAWNSGVSVSTERNRNPRWQQDPGTWGLYLIESLSKGAVSFMDGRHNTCFSRKEQHKNFTTNLTLTSPKGNSCQVGYCKTPGDIYESQWEQHIIYLST